VDRIEFAAGVPEVGGDSEDELWYGLARAELDRFGEPLKVGFLLNAAWQVLEVEDGPGLSERAFWTEPSFSWTEVQDILGDPTLDLGEDFMP
jgi:hypothetical protein